MGAIVKKMAEPIDDNYDDGKFVKKIIEKLMEQDFNIRWNIDDLDNYIEGLPIYFNSNEEIENIEKWQFKKMNAKREKKFEKCILLLKAHYDRLSISPKNKGNSSHMKEESSKQSNQSILTKIFEN